MYRVINLIGIITLLVGMKHGGFGGEELYSFNVLLIGGCLQLYYQGTMVKEKGEVECPDYISRKMVEDIESLKENKDRVSKKVTNSLKLALAGTSLSKVEEDVLKFVNINK